MPVLTEPSDALDLLHSLPDPHLVINDAGQLVWANQSAETLFGVSASSAIGMSVLDLIHPDDVELALVSLVSVMDQEVGKPLEIRTRAADGWRLVEIIGRPGQWLGTSGVLISVRDITGRRQFELLHDDDAALRTIVENSAILTLLLDPDGSVRSASGALTRLLGHNSDHVIGRPLVDIVVESDRDTMVDALLRADFEARASNPVVTTVRLYSAGFTASLPFELALVNLVDDPTVGGIVVTGHDATVRTTAEAELRHTLSLLEASQEASTEGTLVVDLRGRFTSFNSRFADMWQLPEAILEHGTDSVVLAYAKSQLCEPAAFLARVDEYYRNPDLSGRDVIEFVDGRVYERYTAPQMVDGHIVGRVWSYRDLTEQKRLEARLAYQAYHDPLTGLGNRLYFQDHLARALVRASRNRLPVAVFFLDLDGFKQVNDSYGHQIGDRFLQAVANVLTRSVRDVDSLARLGGDEFGIIIEEVTSQADVLQLADRILEAFARPLSVANHRLKGAVSIGITFGDPGAQPDVLFDEADIAMYVSKSAGGDRVVVFDPEFRPQTDAG